MSRNVTKSAGKIQVIISLFIILGILVFALASLAGSVKAPGEGGSPIASDAPAATDSDEAPAAEPSKVRFMAAGDNLIHSNIYEQAAERANGSGYDFSYAYDAVRDIISKADIAMINQETPIDSSKEPSTYPNFNSPTQLGDEMVNLGFNVVSLANNHIRDQYYDGALASIKYWKSKDVVLTGAYENEEDLKQVKKHTVNGITFGYVGVTSYLNGYNINPDETDLRVVSLTDAYRSEEEIDATVKSMIEAAKAECDVVVVSMHWEREDDTTVTEGQEAWVQQMVDWGADIIVGTGPHVVQKIEYRNAADGSKALVLYSLGNFISAQSSPYNLVTGIADIEIEKNNESGEISINSVDIIPVVTQYSSGYSDLHLVKLQDFNSELEAKNGAGLTYSYAKELLESVIGKEYISSLRSGE